MTRSKYIIHILSFLSIIAIIWLIVRANWYSSIYEPFQSLYKWNNCGLNQKKLIQTFDKYGCVIIPKMLTNKDCDRILDLVNYESSRRSQETGHINSNHKRKDLMLPLEDTEFAVQKICAQLASFCDTLTPHAKIVENSSLTSYPGCFPQVWHSDTNHKSSKDANLISFGVALDDITDEMGPLEVYLESNSIYTESQKLADMYKIRADELNGDYDDGLKYQAIESLCNKMRFKKVSCACPKGSLVIWSSKVVHRGGENLLKERPVYYFSLMGSGMAPHGATYSLKSKDPVVSLKSIMRNI